MNAEIRLPAVAGRFYPGEASELSAQVAAMLRSGGSASAPATSATPQLAVPKAIIAPHAGYVYSGPVAARVYALLAPAADTIGRVVLLGPTHRVGVNGLAVPSAAFFATPLGAVEIDRKAVASLADLPQVVLADAPHAQEHSLEVQLPFLQSVLTDFRLVPLAVGHASPEAVAAVLDRLWGGPETLIVVSSDLSHYLPYAAAQKIDGVTTARMLAFDATIDHNEACGATPVNGLLLAARRHGLTSRLVDLRNSGDTAGDRSRVVGYGSFAFFPQEAADADEEGRALLRLARNAIARQFGADMPDEPVAEALSAEGACFVTLTQQGRLRGCIGSLAAWRPLAEDVRENAVAAAFRDPRFPPLTADELPATRIEVSRLSVPEAMTFSSEADALSQMRPGVDGIIFEYRGRRATFLPQVWEELPEPRVFLARLKQKAGFLPAFWSNEVRLWRYGVEKWKES